MLRRVQQEARPLAGLLYARVKFLSRFHTAALDKIQSRDDAAPKELWVRFYKIGIELSGPIQLCARRGL
jgi:hypothetical protein